MSRLPAAERREQLIDTAIGLFAERGYGGTTTAQLAKAAGVTEPIIYRHFESKKQLFIAVVERAGGETIAHWKHLLQNSKDPGQKLRRLVAANPMVAQKGKGLYRVIIQAMTEIDDEDILQALKKHVDSLHSFVAEQVRLAQDEGVVSKAFTPEITAWLLLHMGLGFGVLEALGIDNHAVDGKGTSVRQVVTTLMLGDRAKQLQDEYARRASEGAG